MPHRQICVAILAILAANPGTSAQSKGYYKLQVAFGNYDRADLSNAYLYDGVLLVLDSSAVEIDDSAVNDGVDESFLVILGNGQVTGHWIQNLDFNLSWTSIFGSDVATMRTFPTARLNVDVTGTVLSETADSVTLQLQALIDCTYNKTFTYGSGLGRFGPNLVSWSATDIPLPLVLTVTKNPNGSLVFPINTATTILPLLAAASPAPQAGEGSDMRDFALSGVGVQQTYTVLNIGTWSGGPTLFNFAPPMNDLEPVFSEYYLLGVAAPYGFVASGFVEEPGTLTANFRYGAETLTLPMIAGRSLAPFDYGDAATVVEADILSNGGLLETLSRPLQKLALPPWAGPASAWSAQPGVIYSTSLDWPVSLATSRTLQNASVLTGLWGITGNAESEMEVNAHSLGTPTDGTLQGRVNFHAAGKEFGFTLGGNHAATLNASGLSLSGNCTTSPFTIPLLETNITPLSVVPGLQSAVSGIHPFFERLIRGTGLGLRSQLSLSASGGYEAEPLDILPSFNTGSIEGAVEVSARLNILPDMMRDFLYLGIEGGGGLATTIQLAPTVEMSSLGGHLYFSGTASLFGWSSSANQDYTFGDPAPLALAGKHQKLTRSTQVADLSTEPVIPPAEILPPRSHLAVMMNTEINSSTAGMIVSSVPVTGQPAPASQITVRNLYSAINVFNQWRVHDLTNSYLANLAPTVGNSPGADFGDERQAIVWSHSTTQAVGTAAEREAFANGMELRFQEFDCLLDQVGMFSYDMTSNELCDFGAAIPQVSRQEPVRVFWARSHGTDFTGSTTPLTLNTRRWILPGAHSVDQGWSPEVQAAGGLTHVIDWKALVINPTNAVIVITRDSDGNFATLDDSELWLVREIEGVWGAPVQITGNAVADEQPVMFKDGEAVRVAWRQAGQIVYIPDILTNLSASVLIPASVSVGPGFSKAIFGKRNLLEGGELILIWPESGSLAYAIAESANAVPGGLMALPRKIPVSDDTLTGVGGTLRFANGQTYLETISLATQASAGGPNNVPATTQARLSYDLFALTPTQVSNYHILTPTGNLSVPTGAEIFLQVVVEERPGTTVQWLQNGEIIPGATAGTYRKPGATGADQGSYTLRITDASGTSDVAAGVVTVTETFASWALAQGLVAPLNTRQTDADGDDVPNDLEYLFGTDPENSASRPVTTYRAAKIEDFGSTYDTFAFDVRAAATDCDYAIEHSRDLMTWADLRHEMDQRLDGTLNQTITTSQDGITRKHIVCIENANSDVSLIGLPSFGRVRMIRD